MQALTDDKLYDLQPLALVPDLPLSPAEKVTGSLGVIAMTIAASVVIVALILSVSSARKDTSAARRQTAAAQAETAKAREATSASEARAKDANSALIVKTQQLTDLRSVAVRANSCIEGMFPIMSLLLDESYWAATRSLKSLTPMCSGLGPLLRGTGGSI